MSSAETLSPIESTPADGVIEEESRRLSSKLKPEVEPNTQEPIDTDDKMSRNQSDASDTQFIDRATEAAKKLAE